MKMGKLTLHEAMAIVLLQCENRTANTQEIADEINRRSLFIRPSDGELVPAYQIMMRAKLCKGQYKDWFEFVEPETVKLRNI